MRYLYDPIHSQMCLAHILGIFFFLPNANHLFITMKTSAEVNHLLCLPEMPSAPTVVVCQDLALLKRKM